MKQGQLLMIFLLIYGSCFLQLYCVQRKYDRTLEEKQKVEQALLNAIEYAGNICRDVINENEEKKKKTIAEAFSEAFYISMGLFQTEQPKDFWRMYIPMLVLVEEDGVCFYYMQESEEQVLVHKWTEKIPFIFPESCSVMKKQSLMEGVLEKKASEIITNQNYIAEQYGISYRYSLPVFFKDMDKEAEFPMLFVVFQGWPLNVSDTVYYENCLDAGVFLRKKTE